MTETKKKCNRCYLFLPITDFINAAKKEVKICDKCRIKKNTNDRLYKKRKLEEDPIGFRKHMAKLSNDLYNKNKMNDEYKKLRQNYRKDWTKKNPDKVKAYTKLRNARPEVIIQKYKDNCIIQNKNWLMTDDEALSIINSECYYCGKMDQRGYGGIDRIDSSNHDYTFDACVPCCAMCNYIKRSWSSESFVILCGHIATYNKLPGGNLVYDKLINCKRSEYLT